MTSEHWKPLNTTIWRVLGHYTNFVITVIAKWMLNITQAIVFGIISGKCKNYHSIKHHLDNAILEKWVLVMKRFIIDFRKRTLKNVHKPRSFHFNDYIREMGQRFSKVSDIVLRTSSYHKHLYIFMRPIWIFKGVHPIQFKLYN